MTPSPNSRLSSLTCVRRRLSLIAILPHTASTSSSWVTRWRGFAVRYFRIANGLRRTLSSSLLFQSRSSPTSRRNGGNNRTSASRRPKSRAISGFYDGGAKSPHRDALRRSRSQYQLAAGVAQFELPVRVPHIVEGEDSGDRHL